MRRPLSIVALVALSVAAAACSIGGGERAAAQGPASELGIEVLGIQLLAGGDLARLDFRVIDYERAQAALRGRELAVLTADGGSRLEVLAAGGLGPLRQRPSRSGKKQFVMFTNAGRALEPGASAVVVLGDTRIERVPVS